VLTAAALLIGVSDALKAKWAAESDKRRWQIRRTGECVCTPPSLEQAAAADRRRTRRIADKLAPVVADVLDVLGITKEELDECSRWIEDIY
jgi:hypothetical protein